jgi:hypothetical protein
VEVNFVTPSLFHLAPYLQTRRRAMAQAALLLGLLPCLSACDKPYEKENGAWRYDGKAVEGAPADGLQPIKGPFAKSPAGGYYRGALIEGSDGASFEALDENHARDKARVWHCDTYRKGQDYYTVKYNQIDVMAQADAASFRVITDGYARDAGQLFYAGKRVAVKDLESFVVLDHGYARDKLVGYYERRPVAGSDGASFAALSPNYAKDKARVYYSFMESGEPNVPAVPRSVRVAGADPATFEVLDEGDADAKDARGRYKQGKRLGR